jgi:nucleoside phosphorylase
MPMISSQAQVGLLVALPEELAQIQKQLVRHSGRQQMHGRSGCDYELFCHPDHEDLTIACGTSSGIGILNASLAAHRIVTDVRPGLIVMIGIAGSLSNDAQLGDAVIANAVVHYLAEAKAVDKGKAAFDLRLDGQTTPIDPRLTDTIRRFIDELHRDEQTWENLRIPFSKQEYLSDAAMQQRRRAAELPQVLFGKVASGDVTCGSRNFQKLLTTKDRKLLAIDMESAGAATVATNFRIPWFFVRGISDYSDETKTELDTRHARAHEPVGPWRRHAAEFAGRILVALLPHLAQSLRLGSNEGIAHRERVLQLRHSGHLSPSATERREVAAFDNQRVDPIPPEGPQSFKRFCDRFLAGTDPCVHAVGEEPHLRLIRTSSGAIDISAVSPTGERLHSYGRIEADNITWDPNVELSTEERLQSRFAQIALWLDNVPSRQDPQPPSFAAVDADGNVTVGTTLFLRRFSRTVETQAWTSQTKLGDMRIELMRMLDATDQDGPELVRAVRRSIAAQRLGVTSNAEGIS